MFLINQQIFLVKEKVVMNSSITPCIQETTFSFMLLPLRARIYLKLSSGDFDLLLMNISYIPSGEYKLLPAQKGLGAARQKAKTKTERQEPALVEKAASDIPGGVKRSRAGKVGEASCPLFTVRTAHRVSAHPLAQERHQTEVSSVYRHQLVQGAGAFVP